MSDQIQGIAEVSIEMKASLRRGRLFESAPFVGFVLQITSPVRSGWIELVLQQLPIIRLVIDQMVRDPVSRILLRLAAAGAVVLQRIWQIFWENEIQKVKEGSLSKLNRSIS